MYPLYINIENTNRLSVSFFVHVTVSFFCDDEKISSFTPKSLALSLVVLPSFHREFSLRDAMILEVFDAFNDIRFYFVDLWIGPWKRYGTLSYFHKQMQSEIKIPCCDFLTFTTHGSCLEQVVICKEMAFLQIPRFPRASSIFFQKPVDSYYRDLLV